MVDIKTVIYLVIGLLTIGGAVVAFFQMQTKQNMKIEQLETDVKEMKKRQSDQAHYQIDTEKAIIRIEEKLEALFGLVSEIKEKGCGRNC